MRFHEIGDDVTIKVPADSRGWGYNPAPDGTKGTIIGFETIDYGYTCNFGKKPGVYLNGSWPKVQLETGNVISISSFYVELKPGLFEARRNAYWSLSDDERHALGEKDRVGNLPDTKLWPGDKVRGINDQIQSLIQPGKELVISRINYGWMHSKRNDGSPMPFYEVSDELMGGWHVSANDDELELIERGNVWKYHHNEPTQFADLEEEGKFFKLLGHTSDVRNPSNGLYSWTLEEALEALRNGTAHGITVSGGMFGSNPITGVIKYRDEELGKRVAETTLKGFSDK